MAEKRCALCRRMLPVSEFSRDASKRDGVDCYCLKCRSFYRYNRPLFNRLARNRKYVCAWCGAEYVPDHGNQRYCSEYCRLSRLAKYKSELKLRHKAVRS